MVVFDQILKTSEERNYYTTRSKEREYVIATPLTSHKSSIIPFIKPQKTLWFVFKNVSKWSLQLFSHKKVNVNVIKKHECKNVKKIIPSCENFWFTIGSTHVYEEEIKVFTVSRLYIQFIPIRMSSKSLDALENPSESKAK